MVTVQSVTRHPWIPCRSVSFTVSSTALKNAYGIEPSSTSSRNSTPLLTGAGSTRSPTVARKGLGPLPISSTAAPVPTGRSMQIVADVVLPEVDERVLLGELGERHVERALVGAVAGDHYRLERRRGEIVIVGGRPRRADGVADLDVAEPPELADLARGDRGTLHRRAMVEHADRGDLPLAVPTQVQPVSRSQGPREHADVGDLLAG